MTENKGMDKIAMLNEILAQDPKNAFARYGLAMEYVSKDDLAAAFAQFEQLLKDNPEYVPGYQMYGQTLLKAGKVDEARTLLERGVATAQATGNSHALSEMQGLLDTI